MTQSGTAAKPAKRIRKMAREPKTGSTVDQQPDAEVGTAELHVPSALLASTTKAPTKTNLILSLLRREHGATLQVLVEATGWLPHTTRAALTGIKRKGHVLSSEKVAGTRTYRVTTAETGS